MGDHRALRIAGGARGVADERQILALALLDGGLEVAGVGLGELAPERLHVGERLEPVVLVMQHAARIVVDDDAQRGQLLAQGEHLVDLLLVLGHDHRDVGVIPDERELTGDGVLVDGHRGAPKALRGHLRPVESRSVVADDGEPITPLEAERREPEREIADLGMIVRPRVRLPDSTVLLANGGARRKVAGVAQHQARQRRGLSHGAPPGHRPWCRRGTP